MNIKLVQILIGLFPTFLKEEAWLVKKGVIDEVNPTRPGVLTSEFLTMIVGQVVGILVISGHIEPANANGVTQAFVTVIGGFISMYTAVAYIWGRVTIKKAVINKPTTSPPAPAV